VHLLYDSEDVELMIEQQPDMVALLSAVASLQLPHGYISAGFVRNAVWDALHRRPVSCATLRDVDVVYYDPQHQDPEAEQAFERELTKLIPGVPWEVRNQARMHLRNGDPPYRGTVDALRYYPETATAVAARLVDGRVELAAPLGLSDLLMLVVRPTPNFSAKLALYRERQATKKWALRWPMLRFVEGQVVARETKGAAP
jgi:hypothetical protein